MAKRSAGILLHRRGDAGVEVLLVHPGGPFWAKKDLGAWSIPKGEHEDDEDGIATALREFAEETGTTLEPGSTRILEAPLRPYARAWLRDHPSGALRAVVRARTGGPPGPVTRVSAR